MTLNQLVAQIRSIATSHRVIKSFFEGMVTDRLNDKGTLYPCCFLNLRSGNFSPVDGTSTFDFSLVVVDLVNVSKDAKKNQLDVESDSLQTLQDIYTQIKRPEYSGWRGSDSASFSIIYEGDNDLHGGASLDFSLKTPYTLNACGLPSNNILVPLFSNNANGAMLKYSNTYDYTYMASGNEGFVLSVPLLVGESILLIVRENSVLYEASLVPASNEYSFLNGIITFGTTLNNGEKILILYNEI